jgi:fused signal recognition particle receptor
LRIPPGGCTIRPTWSKSCRRFTKSLKRKWGGKPYKKLLVVDATTGQNALQQAQIFHEAVGVDALILSKMDSTGKGGVAVAISQKLGLPFAFLGLGESQDDLMPFQTEDYLQRLLGDQ